MTKINLNIIVFHSYFIFFITNFSIAQDVIENALPDTSHIYNKQINERGLPTISGFKINQDNFNKGAVIHPLQLMQGKVPGFQINSLNSLNPNPDLQVQLRGISALYSNTDPLYIIDGVPVASADFIYPQNIDSIVVLRRLSETACYGFRGSNGVVIIHTKQNSSKKINFVYNTFGYVEKFAKNDEVLSADEWRQVKQDWATSEINQLRRQSEDWMIDHNSETNWSEEISQNKLSQSHNFGIYGKINKTGYSSSINISDYHGVIQNSNNSFLSEQISLSQLALKDKIKVDVSYAGTKRNFNDIYNNPYLISNYNNIVYTTKTFNPTIPTHAADTFTIVHHNPLQLIQGTKDERSINHSLLSYSTSYEILDGLSLFFLYKNYKSVSKNIFSNDFNWDIIKDMFYKTMEKQNEIEKETTYDLSVDFNRSFGDHNFKTFILYTSRNNVYDYKYNSSMIENDTITSELEISYRGNYKLNSFYTFIRYNFKRKYYLSLGLLKEKFPDFFLDKKEFEKLYPSISAAWLLNKENFLADKEWLNELNLRFDYGKAQRMDRFYYSQNEYYLDPDLKPEVIVETNLGLDLSILSNKLGLIFDYYKRETDNVIQALSFPFGSVSSYLTNNYKVRNKGFEVTINGTPIEKPVVSWTFNINYSYSKNKVLSGTANIVNSLAGHQLGDIIGYEFIGFTSDDEIIINYADTTNGTYDPIIIGNGVPSRFWGITNMVTYRNFDFSISVRGAFDFEIQNKYKFYDFDEFNNKKIIQSIDHRIIFGGSTGLKSTDYFIEKGDYIKIDNISIGYTAPFKNNRLIENVRFYIACNNVAIITDFTGEDPEMAGINGEYPGQYYENYYLTRSFLAGLKIVL